MVGMVDYALHYQKLGFSVIPIDKKSKRAITKFKDKTFTEDEIRRFWHEQPDANIAVRTTDFFVIDIDVSVTENGYESLKEWELSQYIPTTLTATTPSGGKHIFLKKPKGVELSQDIRVKPGIDIKANKNNYVLVAPSNSPKGKYVWDKTTDVIAEAPEEIVAILQISKKAKEPLNFTTDYSRGEFQVKPQNYSSKSFSV